MLQKAEHLPIAKARVIGYLIAAPSEIISRLVGRPTVQTVLPVVLYSTTAVVYGAQTSQVGARIRQLASYRATSLYAV